MITERIFEWAKRTPDRLAMIRNGTPLSYRSFAMFIAIARGFFARRGLAGPGHVVLAMRNLMDFWVISLALRSLGLTTIAVPSAAAVSELDLPDIRCVATNPAETWPGLDRLCAARGLDLLPVALDGEPPLAFDPATPPGGHIMQTSGTTGTYKRVLMSAAIDTVLLRRSVEAIGITQNSVVCTFDFAPWSVIGYRTAANPWLVGGTTVIEQQHVPEPHKAFLRPGLTHAVLVPIQLAAILAAPADSFPRNDAMKLIVGGGPMTSAQVQQAKARITPRIFNRLASTEGGAIAVTPLETEDDHRWHRLLTGRVVQIVDDCDRPVPAGTIGQIRVDTAGGPTGYYHDEAATRSFFRNGFFYPGDLSVMRSDGRVALLGRVTEVINVRGAKISPAPIEDRLCEILGVSGVCLFSMQNEEGEEQLHVVLEAPTSLKPERLTAGLGQELGAFATARIHYTAKLPRNEMGKLMRREMQAQAAATHRQN